MVLLRGPVWQVCAGRSRGPARRRPSQKPGSPPPQARRPAARGADRAAAAWPGEEGYSMLQHLGPFLEVLWLMLSGHTAGGGPPHGPKRPQLAPGRLDPHREHPVKPSRGFFGQRGGARNFWNSRNSISNCSLAHACKLGCPAKVNPRMADLATEGGRGIFLTALTPFSTVAEHMLASSDVPLK